MGLRLGFMVAVVAAATAVLPAPARADDCGETSCGTPSCWDSARNVRPGRSRELTIVCQRAATVKVLEQPAGGRVSDVRVDGWPGLTFTATMEPDATGVPVAAFELTGHDGATMRLDVPLTVVALTQNLPPVCEGDARTQRSDGAGPVDLLLHPYCSDPEEDPFTMVGEGGGTHLQSPLAVPSSSGESNWRYRTATAAGTETATVHAVDELGARSGDATLTVTVGPAVDTPASCGPNGGASGVVHTRPGVIRDFGILCRDPDGDALTASVSRSPGHGRLTLGEGAAETTTVWGTELRIPARYAPLLGGAETDGFGLAASVPGKPDEVTETAIVQRALPDNGGGWCGWSGADVAPDTATSIDTVVCGDEEGDPLTGRVTSVPVHGTAGEPETVALPDGSQQLRIPFRPDAGFEGVDCLTVRVTDGYGLSQDLTVDVVVREPSPEGQWPAPDTPPPPMPVPPPSPTAAPVRPAPSTPGSAAPTTPAARAVATADARAVLGTRKVVRVPVMAGVVAYAPAKLSRRRLATAGRVPGLVVTCARDCALRTRAAWRTRGHAAPAQRTAAQVEPGAPQVVWATAPAPAGRARLDVRLRVDADGRRRTVRHRLTVARR